VFNFSLDLFGAFSICVFAFNCHINVVPVAGRLIRPTKARIGKVATWVNVLQLAFYVLIGVTGYLTFLSKTPQDILKGFADNDPFMAIGRVLLTFTMMITIPINMNPTVRSLLQIRDYFYPDSPVLAPSPRSSPAASPQASPRMGAAAARPLRADDSMGSSPSLGSPGASEPALPRIIVTTLSIAAEVGIAIVVPGVADVIGLLGATVATAMMLVIPAYAIGKVLPATFGNRVQQAVLLFFALVSVASVPVKVLQMAKVISSK
jgi:amino acid permease